VYKQLAFSVQIHIVPNCTLRAKHTSHWAFDKIAVLLQKVTVHRFALFGIKFIR